MRGEVHAGQHRCVAAPVQAQGGEGGVAERDPPARGAEQFPQQAVPEAPVRDDQHALPAALPDEFQSVQRAGADGRLGLPAVSGEGVEVVPERGDGVARQRLLAAQSGQRAVVPPPGFR